MGRRSTSPAVVVKTFRSASSSFHTDHCLAPDYWEWQPARLVDFVFNRIDEIDDQSDREDIWSARLAMGGSTVSYLDLTRRFTRFMGESMTTVREEIV